MMMGRDSGQPAVAGGPAPHIPVLGPQAVIETARLGVPVPRA